ncbi:MAG: hypothetical protein U0556_08165 [Dehalococcoidia bacterium]
MNSPIATVTGSTFVSNTAQSDGGGMNSAIATVTGSSFVSNTAKGFSWWRAEKCHRDGDRQQPCQQHRQGLSVVAG